MIKTVLKKVIKAILPYGAVYFWRKYLKRKIDTKIIFKNYYDSNKYSHGQKPISNTSKKIIYMADGRVGVGGLADRLRGIVSLFKIAHGLGVEFKINFTSPAELTNFLIPNMYDWRISPNDIIYDTRESIIYTFLDDRLGTNIEPKLQDLLKKYNQIHITTNLFTGDYEYGNLFNFLFTPTPELNTLVEYNLSQLEYDFISVSFRFLALLGDFNETATFSQPLPENEQKALKNKCIERLKEIRMENMDCKKILVTSDSITFLNEVKQFDFVHIIPGKIEHTDNKLNSSKEALMKTFTDYFCLVNAKKNYLVVEGAMYTSGFAYRASLHRSSFIVKRCK